MSKIWVISEQTATLLELTGEARRLADAKPGTVTAVALQDRTAAEAALAHGADEALWLKLAENQPLEAAAVTLSELMRDAQPNLVLFGATLRARDLAAQVAAHLGAALGSCATALRVQADGHAEFERIVYGGGGVSTQAFTGPLQLLTISPRTFAAPAANTRGTSIREVNVPVDARVTITARKARAQTGADIAGATVVVGVGRGLSKKEDLAAVQQVASKLGGAVGCTRPVAEDLQWLPEETYIGISGRKIAPQLYLALGLSGQVQHLAGMRDSKLVVAINKDEKAPIFEHADVGLVAALETALPTLIDELTKLGR